MDNKINLNQKVLKDLYTFLIRNENLNSINFKKIKFISKYEKYKCLIISKNISKYFRKEKKFNITNDFLLSLIISEKFCENNIIYKKNIELIKFYIIIFHDTNCSHLAFYLCNNLNYIKYIKKPFSIIIQKHKNTSIILNENLDLIVKRNFKKPTGKIINLKFKNPINSTFKYKILLACFSVIIAYTLFFNIPSSYVVLDMNIAVHMRTNCLGKVLTYRPKSNSAKKMIKDINLLRKPMNESIVHFINYGLENKILTPGNDVKIYVLGSPLSKNNFKILKKNLKEIPLNIIINNSGNLIKIHRT